MAVKCVGVNPVQSAPELEGPAEHASPLEAPRTLCGCRPELLNVITHGRGGHASRTHLWMWGCKRGDRPLMGCWEGVGRRLESTTPTRIPFMIVRLR